ERLRHELRRLPLIELAFFDFRREILQDRKRDVLMSGAHADLGELGLAQKTAAAGALPAHFAHENVDAFLRASMLRSLLGRIEYVGHLRAAERRGRLVEDRRRIL